MANKIPHPRNVYLAEHDVLPSPDDWLTLAFAPHRLTETIEALYDGQPDIDADPAVIAAGWVSEECDQKLARYRQALEAGTDPALVAAWTAEVQARRARPGTAPAKLVGTARWWSDLVNSWGFGRDG